MHNFIKTGGSGGRSPPAKTPSLQTILRSSSFFSFPPNRRKLKIEDHTSTPDERRVEEVGGSGGSPYIRRTLVVHRCLEGVRLRRACSSAWAHRFRRPRQFNKILVNSGRFFSQEIEEKYLFSCIFAEIRQQSA